MRLRLLLGLLILSCANATAQSTVAHHLHPEGESPFRVGRLNIQVDILRVLRRSPRTSDYLCGFGECDGLTLRRLLHFCSLRYPGQLKVGEVRKLRA